MEVMRHIRAAGKQVVRLNGETLANEALQIRLAQSGSRGDLQLDEAPLPLADVRAVWYRRNQEHTMASDLDLGEAKGDILQHVADEDRAFKKSLHGLLKHAHWLGSPETAVPNKLQVLHFALEQGLEIPPTLVTTKKSDLLAFKRDYGDIICKPLGDCRVFSKNGSLLGMYTTKLDDTFLSSLPARFFPAMCQAYIKKSWEIRSFYLGEKFYSMAILSQCDPQTHQDFRRYNNKRPNRYIPYCLPAKIEIMLKKLMRAIKLKTGSIDLIRTPEKKFVFLEVNPVGQFSFVSETCNYHLEKRVAEYLMEKAGCHA